MENNKLILVLLRGNSDRLVHQLNDAGFRVTEFSSIGGFLRHKYTTLVIGVRQERVEPALELIRKACPTPPDAEEHNATIFVLNAGQFVQF
ncbi:MAG: hypothetical protein EHM39_13490 [Chloroflexi bacterium]|nr:MAG: hypothetical protein EHM39_13490 [Chloroflexota bacterium]